MPAGTQCQQRRSQLVMCPRRRDDDVVVLMEIGIWTAAERSPAPAGEFISCVNIVEVVDVIGACRACHLHREYPEALRSADDQNPAVRPRRQRAACRDPRVRQIVADGCRSDRIDAVRNLDQHGIGEWNADALREQSSPMASSRYAKARIFSNAGAGDAATCHALFATSAGDLPWYRNDIPAAHRCDARANFEDLGDALMTDRERWFERCLARDQSSVEVAVASSYRADDRIESCLHLRRRLVQPSQFARLNDGQFLHDSSPRSSCAASHACNGVVNRRPRWRGNQSSVAASAITAFHAFWPASPTLMKARFITCRSNSEALSSTFFPLAVRLRILNRCRAGSREIAT